MSIHNPGFPNQNDQLNILGGLIEAETQSLETGRIAKYSNSNTAKEADALLFGGRRVINEKNLFPQLETFLEVNSRQFSKDHLEQFSQQLLGRVSLLQRKVAVNQAQLSMSQIGKLTAIEDTFSTLIAKVDQIILNKVLAEEAFQNTIETLFPKHAKLEVVTSPFNLLALVDTLRRKKPGITLPQAAEILQMHYYMLAQGREDPSMAEIIAILEAHFAETRRPDALAGLKANLEKAQLSGLCTPPRNMEVVSEVNKTYFESLMQNFHSSIATKLRNGPSVTSAAPELFAPIDLKILSLSQDLYTHQSGSEQHLARVQSTVSEALQKALEVIKDYGLDDVDQIRELIHQEGIEGVENQYLLSVKQAALKMKTDDEIGSLLNIANFTSPESLEHLDLEDKDSFTRKMSSLLELNKINTPELDEAVLESAIDTHDSAPYHPKVIIEGAGPTGLMLALTQYTAGADVGIIEARNTQYSRTQIVRLDPKWVALLEYHLGSQFSEYFEVEGAPAIKRPDGFVEIVIRDLETLLHNKMQEITSKAEENGSTGIERITEHKIRHTVRPSERDTTFSILAQSEGGRGDTFIRREFDILFAAGGARSDTREKYLPSYSPVTQESEYGVCSWENYDLKARQFNAFEDFRGILKMDDTFKDRFLQKLQRYSWTPAEATFIGNINFFRLDQAAALFPHTSVETEKGYLQTRGFENKNVLYIGMEIPQEMKAFLQFIEEQVDAQGFSSQSKKEFIAGIQKCWYQSVMDHYQLDTKLGLTEDKIITRSMGNFPVAQQRSAQGFSSMHNPYGHNAIIMPAGDASASPHFMSGSGLSSARQNIFHAKKYTEQIAKLEDQAEAENTLSLGYEHTSQFAIQRGRVYVDPLSDAQIIEGRKARIRSQLDAAVEKTADLPSSGETPYKIVRESENEYRAELYGTRIGLEITDTGTISFRTVRGEGTSVDSVSHLEIELGIDDHTNINYRLSSDNQDLQRTALAEIANDPTLLAFSFDNLKALTDIAKDRESPQQGEAIEVFRKISPRLCPEEFQERAAKDQVKAEEVLFSMLHVCEVGGLTDSPTHTKVTQLLQEIVVA